MYYDNFIADLKELVKHQLPGESAHHDLLPLNRKPTSKALTENENYRLSAVAVLLYKRDREIHSILIQRSRYEGMHGAQISFPGGKMDPDDSDLEYTARRECFEEINFPTDTGILLGNLSPVHIPVSKFLVQPYLFFVDDLPPLLGNEREVEEIITFNTSNLLKPDVLKRSDIQVGNGLIRKDIPYFDIDGRIVWGATAMILSELRALLSKI